MRRPPKAFFERAKTKLRNPSQLRSLIEQASQKLSNSKSLSSVREEIHASIRLLQAWKNKEYRDISLKPLLRLSVALLYFVWIIDLVPDFLVGVGLLDDLSVFLWALSGMRNEIQKYQQWETQKKPEASD